MTLDRNKRFFLASRRGFIGRMAPLVLISVIVQVTALVDKAADTPAQAPDLRQLIDSQIEAGLKTITVPPGRYRVSPRDGSHLRFRDVNDVRIIAAGVEMVCTETCQAIGFDHCRNLTFKGLTIDYDPLCYTQGRIVAMAPDKSWLEFALFDGYPENRLEERIEIYDPATTELRRETVFGWALTKVGERRYRAAKPGNYRYRPETDTEQIGDILVTNNMTPRAGGHAVSISRCTGLTLENVTVYASPCFGFIEDQCDATTYLHCKIDRRPASDDPVKRAYPRMRSLDADAYHSTQATKGPAIIGCTAKFQGDDCVNIHGMYHLVTAASGRHVRLAALGNVSISAGDPVEFLPYSGARPPDAVCEKIDADGPMTDDERAFFEKVTLNADIRRGLLQGRARFYQMTLDRGVALPIGSAVCSGNRVGNGFIVKDCDFGFNRSRGILIKASRGQVTGNTITHGWMAAVLVSPEFWWMEAASSSDVTISNNKIIGCRRPAIEVVAPGGDGHPLASGAHRNISITGNEFIDSVWPCIRVESTSGLVIDGNQLQPSEPTTFVPPIDGPWRWRSVQHHPMLIEQSDAAQVQAMAR